MKFSPNAAAQMYPQLVKVECEAHGEQARSRVPSQLVKAFQDRPFACNLCVLEAKKTWDDNLRELKRKKVEDKESKKAAVKEWRDSAQQADGEILSHIKQCEAAGETIKTKEQELASTRSKLTEKKKQAQKALERLEIAQKTVALLNRQVMGLSELSLEQFEDLEQADSDRHLCYNTLQAAVAAADTVWDALGKSLRKKRNKANKKAALSLLREHNVKLQTVKSQLEDGNVAGQQHSGGSEGDGQSEANQEDAKQTD
jgi:hypothetical protein